MEEASSVIRFQSLDAYQVPSKPTDETVRSLHARALSFFRKSNAEPVIFEEALIRTPAYKLDRVIKPPAYGSVMQELQVTFQEWLESSNPNQKMQLVVLPSGYHGCLMRDWAAEQSLKVIEPPDPMSVLMNPGQDLPDLSCEGVLVIPKLESWFLRHENGLILIRRLLIELLSSQQKVMIGCNSWAWKYLSHALRLKDLLPNPLIFRPFDAKRLHDWLVTFTGSQWYPIHFRRADLGGLVFDPEGEDQSSGAFFKSLAARSLGIPWVAWHQWRDGLYADIDIEQLEKHEHDEEVHENTLWVGDIQSFSLPSSRDPALLMILHALLIHGSLTEMLLVQLLPFDHVDLSLHALIKSSCVKMDAKGLVSLNPLAYPMIRSNLSLSGYPIGVI